jgi:GT2 family glycosyltransferase
MDRLDARVSVVVLTHERADEVLRSLRYLAASSAAPPLIVVDNASRDGTAERVAREFPQARLVRLPRNLGAAGRNLGVTRAATPYVAFCDDDVWWADGALARAADLLDAHADLAVVAARVLVGADERVDPTCEFMAASPLDARGLPGPALIGFMAGACVTRVRAFREAGGYEARLCIGAEESLLGLDLAARGWRMVYAADVVAHHHPSVARDPARRRMLLARNRIWIAWLRLSSALAWRETRAALREAKAHGVLARTLWRTLGGLGWVASRRRPVAPNVERMYRAVQDLLVRREDGSERRAGQQRARPSGP